jgi:hypothetical protein
VRQHLSAHGWPEPVQCDSGNGWRLLYAIDLPADDGGLVKGVLHALAGRFDDAHLTIDPRVFNPARITKLYGAKACKGDDRPDRPHRWSRVVQAPAELRAVTEQQLKALIPPPPVREKSGWSRMQYPRGVYGNSAARRRSGAPGPTRRRCRRPSRAGAATTPCSPSPASWCSASA